MGKRKPKKHPNKSNPSHSEGFYSWLYTFFKFTAIISAITVTGIAYYFSQRNSIHYSNNSSSMKYFDINDHTLTFQKEDMNLFGVCESYGKQHHQLFEESDSNMHIYEELYELFHNLDSKVWFDEGLELTTFQRQRIVDSVRAELPAINDNKTLRALLSNPSFRILINTHDRLKTLAGGDNRVIASTSIHLNAIFLDRNSFDSSTQKEREATLRNELYSMATYIYNCNKLYSHLDGDITNIQGGDKYLKSILIAPALTDAGNYNIFIDTKQTQEFAHAIGLGTSRCQEIFERFLIEGIIDDGMLQLGSLYHDTQFIQGELSIELFNKEFTHHRLVEKSTVCLRAERFPFELKNIKHNVAKGTISFESRLFYGINPSEENEAMALIYYIGKSLHRHSPSSTTIYQLRDNVHQLHELASTVREFPFEIQQKYFPEWCDFMSKILQEPNYCLGSDIPSFETQETNGIHTTTNRFFQPNSETETSETSDDFLASNP